MSIEGVIFDIGGVLARDVWEHLLLEPHIGICAQYALDRNQVEKAGELLWQSFAHTPETKGSSWQTLEQLYWSRFIDYFHEHLPSGLTAADLIKLTDDFISPVEGMALLLERLQSDGIVLAICSNNNEFWFRRQMDKLQLHRFFSPNKVILSCRVGFSKSSPRYEMFHAAADALNIPKAKCVFVDDRLDNVERSRQCGMHGILFRNADQLRVSLREVGLLSHRFHSPQD